MPARANERSWTDTPDFISADTCEARSGQPETFAEIECPDRARCNAASLHNNSDPPQEIKLKVLTNVILRRVRFDSIGRTPIDRPYGLPGLMAIPSQQSCRTGFLPPSNIWLHAEKTFSAVNSDIQRISLGQPRFQCFGPCGS